jgi:hypothetical protein
VVQQTVQETVNVTQSYCERVPYTTTIRVPVSGAAGYGGPGYGGPGLAAPGAGCGDGHGH